MAHIQYVNHFTATLATNIGESDTVLSLTLTNSSAFTVNSNSLVPLTILNPSSLSVYEVVYCSAVSGNSYTVIRGKEGGAQSWPAGALVKCGTTALLLNQASIAGSQAIWSSTVSSLIGGYTWCAVVADSSGTFWVSTADNNGTQPGAASANWKKFGQDMFVKQGWGFSNFGNNAIYMGWRPDGNLGLGIDSTDVGNVALQGAGKLAQGGWTEQYYTLSAGGSRTLSLTFTAPVAGYVHVIGSANYSVQNSNQTSLTVIVNGQSLSADQVTGTTAMTNHSCVRVEAGQVTVSSYCGTSSQNPPNVGHTLSYIFIPE